MIEMSREFSLNIKNYVKDIIHIRIHIHNLNLKPNLAQGPWQNAQMVHIQYICHLNFKEDRFLANNACNLCMHKSKQRPLHVAVCSIWQYRLWSFKLLHTKTGYYCESS